MAWMVGRHVRPPTPALFLGEPSVVNRNIPPVHAVLGIVEDARTLPERGDLGDAWYEEAKGRLWIWDDKLSRWVDLSLWRAGAAVAGVSGAAGVPGPAGSAARRERKSTPAEDLSQRVEEGIGERRVFRAADRPHQIVGDAAASSTRPAKRATGW